MIKTLNSLKNSSTITVSEGIFYLSQANKPNHLKNLYIGIPQELQTKWYNYLVDHGCIYYYAINNRENMLDFNESNPESIRHPDIITDGIVSDKEGNNISGLTRDQYIQLQLWYEEREYPRLLKVYKEYLRSLGIFEIGIFKPGRLRLGVKFRHRL